MSFPDVHRQVLANGLTVLAVAAPESPTFSHQLWFRVGARHEPEGQTGLSHLIEHLMFRGTSRHPEGEYDRLMQEHGMMQNAWTGHDTTVFHVNGAGDRLTLAMELEADRMRGLELTEEAVSTELSVVREERKQTVEDLPYGRLSEEVDARVFPHHAYGRPVIGRREDLDRLTRQQVRDYYDRFYHPGNAVLVIVADRPAAASLDLAIRHYSAIAAGPALVEPEAADPPVAGEQAVSLRRDVELPGLLLVYRAPAAGEPGAKACNLLEFLLLHGRSSRLYQRLVYRRPWAADLSGGYLLRRDPSCFSLRATARPGVSLEALQQAIEEALDELQQDLVDGRELAKVQRVLEADFVFSQESRFELAHILGEDECRSTWRDSLRWVEEHCAVTPQEIRDTARAVFLRARRTIGYLLPNGGPEQGEPRAA